jgi:iron complex outermembrane receptor protein
MDSAKKLASAIASALGAHVVASAYAAPFADQPAAGLEDIVVTAQRRTETVQDVPIVVQVLTGETLAQLNASTFEDFVKFLPNVTAAGDGPGQNNIAMRGLATTGSGGGVGSFPNVAIYLDEQSGQLPSRNLDIYAADLDRIEVLEGPQGTLFGAGAQAGVLRYITNKPKLNVTEGNVNAGYAITASGQPSTSLDATINLPAIADTLALRAVIYNEVRGGYINDIPGTFARSPSDKGVVNYFGGVVPPNSGPITNSAEVGNAINPLSYNGIRVSALYQFNDDWNALIAQSYQSLAADGVFWQEAFDGLGKELPPNSVQLYNPSYNHDRFENTAWTLNGRVDQLRVLYSGGFLDRNVDQQLDYTNYSRGFYASYYQCNYPGYPFSQGKPTPGTFTKSNTFPGQGVSPGYCFSPSSFLTERENAIHQSHEVRVSTPDEWRWRGVGGLFWENYTIHDQVDFFYTSSPNFSPIGPPTIDPATGGLLPASCNNCSVRPTGETFFNDITRGYTQEAAFVSTDLDIIPHVLTITGGTRYYDMSNFEVGSQVGSFGCEIQGPYNGVVPIPCVSTPTTGVLSNLNNLDAKNLHKTYAGFKSRFNLSWHASQDALLYYTWSQGFRPGGFNRAQSVITSNSPLYGLFTPPLAYQPDALTNNEIGWKTEWLNHRVQFNGAIYQENWKNTQISIFDPGVTGDLTFTTNGPDYRVRGLEASLVARVARGLTLTAAGSWNTSGIVKTLDLTDPKTGQPIPIANPFGALGSPLAQSPPFQGNIRLRYEFALGAQSEAFWQLAGQHQSGSYVSTDHLTKTLVGPGGGPPVSVAFYDPAFTTYDASLGVVKGPWTTQLYGENITNTRAILSSDYSLWVKAETINRPRTLGLRLNFKFGGT